MKRIYIGLFILAVLLFMAITFTILMDHIHTPVSIALQEAAEAADREDWSVAAELTKQAAARWNRYRRLSAIVADHSPMDEIDGLFAELEVYLQYQEMPHFSSTCRHLAMLAEAMGDNHSFSWWNVL